MTLKTHDNVISYTSTRSYNNIVSPKICSSYFSTKKWNLFQSKEMMNMLLLVYFVTFHVQYVNFCYWNYHETYKKSKKFELSCTRCSKKKETFFEHLPQERALNISSKNSIWSKPYNLWTLQSNFNFLTFS